MDLMEVFPVGLCQDYSKAAAGATSIGGPPRSGPIGQPLAIDRYMDAFPRVVGACVEASSSNSPGSDPRPHISPRFGDYSPRPSGPRSCGRDQPCRQSVMSNKEVSGSMGQTFRRSRHRSRCAATIGAPAGILEHPGQLGIYLVNSDGDALVDLVSMDFSGPEVVG